LTSIRIYQSTWPWPAEWLSASSEGRAVFRFKYDRISSLLLVSC